jgi:peptidoglycan/xylan/chitin deacetylase (PgdA/CDA1 family)
MFAKKKLLLLNLILTILVIISISNFLDKVYTVPVLMYHSINYDAKGSRLIVEPETFKKHMQYLRKKNFNIMSLDEYVELIKNNRKPAKKSVVITFDDGYKDNYENMLPVLEALKIPATVFIVTDWVGNDDMMSWEQVKELSDNELIEVGSHAITHDMLTRMPMGQAIREIRLSKQVLEEKLDKPIRFFCYPTGAHSEFIKEFVRLAGYKAACATSVDKRTEFDDLFAIRRIRISQSADNMLIFAVQISGYYTFFKDRRIKEGKWIKY